MKLYQMSAIIKKLFNIIVQPLLKIIQHNKEFAKSHIRYNKGPLHVSSRY